MQTVWEHSPNSIHFPLYFIISTMYSAHESLMPVLEFSGSVIGLELSLSVKVMHITLTNSEPVYRFFFSQLVEAILVTFKAVLPFFFGWKLQNSFRAEFLERDFKVAQNCLDIRKKKYSKYLNKRTF